MSEREGESKNEREMIILYAILRDQAHTFLNAPPFRPIIEGRRSRSKTCLGHFFQMRPLNHKNGHASRRGCPLLCFEKIKIIERGSERAPGVNLTNPVAQSLCASA